MKSNWWRYHPSFRIIVRGCTPVIASNPSDNHVVASLLSDDNSRWNCSTTAYFPSAFHIQSWQLYLFLGTRHARSERLNLHAKFLEGLTQTCLCSLSPRMQVINYFSNHMKHECFLSYVPVDLDHILITIYAPWGWRADSSSAWRPGSWFSNLQVSSRC